jgi:hypothetical protein
MRTHERFMRAALSWLTNIRRQGDNMQTRTIGRNRWCDGCVAAVVFAAAAAHADATTGTFSVATTLSDPCAVFVDPVTARITYGEPIFFHIDGSTTAVFDVSDSGQVNLKFHLQAHGHGEGERSGIAYVFHANAQLKAHTVGDPFAPDFHLDETFELDARIIGQGNALSEATIAQGAQDNAVVHFAVRVRMGEGTVEGTTTGFTIECQGSPWMNLMEDRIAGTKEPVERGFGDPWNKYAWSMEDFAGGLVVGTKNAWYDATALLPPSPMVQACIDDPTLPAPEVYKTLACLELFEPGVAADAGLAEIWRHDHAKKTWRPANLDETAPSQGFRIMTTHEERLFAGSDLGAFITGVALQPGSIGQWDFPGTQLLVSDDGQTFTAIASCESAGPCNHIEDVPFEGIGTNPVNSSIRALASYNGRLFVGTFNLTGGQLWAYEDEDDSWMPIATLPAAAVTELRVLGSTLFVGVSGGAPGVYLYRYTDDEGLAVVAAPTNPPYLATSLGTLTLFSTSRGVLYVGTVDLEAGFTLQTTTDGLAFQTVTADGFGNPANGYAWSIAELNGRVFVGTFNQGFGGVTLPRGTAELWFSDDDTNWRQMPLPVDFGLWNYGIRTMDVGKRTLFLGTASVIVAPDLTLLDEQTFLSPGTEIWALRASVAAPTSPRK